MLQADFWFLILGIFWGEKTQKNTPKIPPNFIFSGFSADLDEIWYKIVFWSPKTKSEDNFLKFWKGGPQEGGRGGIHQNFQKLCLPTDFDEIWF